jgi:hypothetical protein
MRFIAQAVVCGLFVVTSLLSGTSFAANTNNKFPTGPDASLTPGEVCTQSNTFRYPEHIKYCNRNVSTGLKRDIIRDYDRKLGYSIENMNRQDFKIDHYIPLCMGGGNDRDNLWPQHKSVYILTDPIEPLACQRMAEGKLLQAKAIELIKEAKNDLSKVQEVMDYLTNL